jgi:hypothetical protein
MNSWSPGGLNCLTTSAAQLGSSHLIVIVTTPAERDRTHGRPAQLIRN